MNRKIVNQMKDWGIMIFWICFVIGFMYLIITVKEFALIH